MGVKSINLTNLPKIMAQRDQQTFLASSQTIVLKSFLKVCPPEDVVTFEVNIKLHIKSLLTIFQSASSIIYSVLNSYTVIKVCLQDQ